MKVTGTSLCAQGNAMRARPWGHKHWRWGHFSAAKVDGDEETAPEACEPDPGMILVEIASADRGTFLIEVVAP